MAFRPGLGRGVCGVAVKAERPEAEPRTYGLEGGVVGAMLVEPGRRDVQDVVSGRVFTTVEPVVGGRPGFGCRSSIRPASMKFAARGHGAVRPGSGRVNQGLGCAASCREPYPHATTRPIGPKIMLLLIPFPLGWVGVGGRGCGRRAGRSRPV